MMVAVARGRTVTVAVAGGRTARVAGTVTVIGVRTVMVDVTGGRTMTVGAAKEKAVLVATRKKTLMIPTGYFQVSCS